MLLREFEHYEKGQLLIHDNSEHFVDGGCDRLVRAAQWRPGEA